MQRANPDMKLDLKDFVPPWERKIADSISETEFDRLLRDYGYIPVASGGKGVIRHRRALAQDVFSALIVRQRRV